MFIGAHVSIRKGYYEAARSANAGKMRAYQFFTKNPRSLSMKKWDAKDAELCLDFVRENDMRSIVHAPYPVNLAVDDEQLQRVTVQSVLNDLHICEACGGLGVVVHFGHYKGADLLPGYRNMIRLLDEILAQWSGKAYLLIENTAGSKNPMGTTLEELTHIRNMTQRPEGIGFCLDTCHAFASGLWTAANSEELLNKGQQLGYWEHLRAVHLNDSLYPGGSRKDRHAPLGKGYIGWSMFQALLGCDIFVNIPFILETPSTNVDPHAQQIEHFMRLINETWE